MIWEEKIYDTEMRKSNWEPSRRMTEVSRGSIIFSIFIRKDGLYFSSSISITWNFYSSSSFFCQRNLYIIIIIFLFYSIRYNLFYVSMNFILTLCILFSLSLQLFSFSLSLLNLYIIIKCNLDIIHTHTQFSCSFIQSVIYKRVWRIISIYIYIAMMVYL